ncbi:MAG: L-threonylcarbamoyladenylate synthase [Patescibacteria group bacterium]
MKIVLEKEVDITQLAEVLAKGGVLVMPTETAYGLIADATNKQAVELVYTIKKRDRSMALPVVCSSIIQVDEFFSIPSLYEDLIESYWPGPLSLTMQPKSDHKVYANPQGVFDGSVAVRITSHKLLNALADHYNKPLIATSANKSQDATPYSLDDVRRSLSAVQDSISYAVDSGVLSEVLPSTLVGIKENELVTLRQGPITV